jgi:hypothetical protein
MISECLSNINDETDLHLFYNQDSPNKAPPFLICRDKLQKQNNEVQDYILNKNNNKISSLGTYKKYNLNMCNDTLNHKLYTENRNEKISTSYLNDNINNLNNNIVNLDNTYKNLIIHDPNELNKYKADYKQYVSKIDVESDLKQINHIQDKCYNDNYILNRNEGEFKQHKKIYNKEEELMHYMKNKAQKSNKLNKLRKRNEKNTNCMTFNKDSDSDSDNDNDNNMINDNIPLEYNYEHISILQNEKVNYIFNNQDYCRDFECQKQFNNMTRRT